MRAVLFDGELSVTELPDPRPEPGEALIRVSRAGVCNTDLELVKGYMGFRGVLGHEFVGVVEDGPDNWRGRRVVGCAGGAETRRGCAGSGERCRSAFFSDVEM